ncbi:DUF4350 domain-containing protein [Halorussus litoreus]|uniref:DUF4350 domain-containing protein n=1 Tax=Halorussus litoreus TaxID=1710536 RepID=UPI0013009E98|nr:DUF4350 domain-containing protein [Halorussus litoreus]
MARDDWREWASIPNFVLAALVVAVLGTSMVPLATSAASYSPYNDDWDGTTDVRSIAHETGLRIQFAHETATYSEVRATDAVAFVLSPDEAYSSGDAARVTDFVRRGGTLVVADDYGPHANELLRRLGASARIDGRPVRDPRSNYRSPAMPVATPVADHPFVAGVDNVTLNYGTTVDPGDATPLLNTSENAYLDGNRDGVLGPNETLESRPVATVERVGEGQVVVVGDASAFINAMVERPGNRAFVGALQSGHGTVVLDHSHADGLPPAILALLFVRSSAVVQFGLGALAVGALAVWAGRPAAVSNRLAGLRWWRDGDARRISGDDPRASASELAAYLERKRPEWDRERVERVAAAMQRRRER